LAFAQIVPNFYGGVLYKNNIKKAEKLGVACKEVREKRCREFVVYRQEHHKANYVESDSFFIEELSRHYQEAFQARKEDASGRMTGLLPIVTNTALKSCIIPD